MIITTTGVYGDTEDSFFNKLLDEKITLFVDVRQRRGMRGSKYKFVNSVYLQEKLRRIGIKYIHLKSLAPTTEIRLEQKKHDQVEQSSKNNRNELGLVFIKEYNNKILDQVDFVKILEVLNKEKSVLFCVETKPCACHRSLISRRIEEELSEMKNCESKYDIYHF